MIGKNPGHGLMGIAGHTKMGNALTSCTKVAAETEIATALKSDVIELVIQQQVCGACRYMLDF